MSRGGGVMQVEYKSPLVGGPLDGQTVTSRHLRIVLYYATPPGQPKRMAMYRREQIGEPFRFVETKAETDFERARPRVMQAILIETAAGLLFGVAIVAVVVAALAIGRALGY